MKSKLVSRKCKKVMLEKKIEKIGIQELQDEDERDKDFNQR